MMKKDEHIQPTSLSQRSKGLKQSSIRSVSQRCQEIDGINLGQGVCDIETQQVIKDAAAQAIYSNHNMYSSCEGVLKVRQALAKKIRQFNNIDAHPDTEIMLSHGSTGAFVCASQVLFNPGDEVIIFEPFYGYHKNLLELFSITVKPVSFDLNDLSINITELESTIGDKTRGIVICTPCNPCGKVFSHKELMAIGRLAEKYDLYIIADEIYEYITYPDYEHISIASLSNFWYRTVTISGFSKTYNITGWRLGYASAPAAIIQKMALLHDLIYVCPPTPLQYAMLAALNLPDDYYRSMRTDFLYKRNYVAKCLQQCGFGITLPQGAYYIMADISHLPFANDKDAASQLLEKAKIAAVPGHAFFLNADTGKNYLRFCFALNEKKLTQAMRQLANMFNISKSSILFDPELTDI